MKFLEVFRFELAYQSRRVSTWLFFVVLLAITFHLSREAFIEKAHRGGYFFNSSTLISEITVLTSLMALLVSATLAGDAAARDVQTRMHPLIYTTPVGTSAYLGGRFLAAFVLNALILVAVPIALLLATLLPVPAPEVIGPFRPEAYLGAYFFVAVPNAFAASALVFSLAALSRRAMASYLGAVLVFFATVLSWLTVAEQMGRWGLAKLIDPMGLTVLVELSRSWTPVEKSTRLIGLEGSLLWNRFVWLGVAVCVLALTHMRFRFAHHTARGWWGRRERPNEGSLMQPDAAEQAASARRAPVAVPRVRRAFGTATQLRQMLAIAWESFRDIIRSWGGLVLACLTVLLVITGPQIAKHLDIPLFPTTEQFTGFLSQSQDLFFMVVPLLIVFYAGELVWREREAGLSEIADAAPVRDWIPFVGKFLGLSLVLVVLQLLMIAAAMTTQALMGYYEFELGLYARVLLGIQLGNFLLLAVLAVVVHVIADQKYVGHMIALVAFGFMTFAPAFGIENNLFVYGSDPGWSYSDLSGFGASLAPLVWFKLYWAGWALLLAVAAKLLWVRGKEREGRSRLRQARRRFTRPIAGAAVTAGGLILSLGGFVFYNTNVLNEYRTPADWAKQRADYEKRYGKYDGIPQPTIAATNLRVEIHPTQRAADLRGTYRLVNRTAAAIDSVHVVTDANVDTRALGFDRPATCVLADSLFGHRIFVLDKRLEPGDSLQLTFDVRFARRGFPNRGIDESVVPNGTFFTAQDWLPGIGYQKSRELNNAGDRRANGLAPRPAFRSLDDIAARWDVKGAERVMVDAIVGTDDGQVAVGPGALRRAWKDNGRQYFHYATDAPIRNEYAFYSARYAVHEARWKDVAIQIVYHPGHAWNVDRMARSVQASLDDFSRRFGPYPYHQIRLVEHVGEGVTLHAPPINIAYQEGFSLLNSKDDPRNVDFAFAVVAHEVAHQWWGDQVFPARVEGAALLSESLAWYSAMSVVEGAYGRAHLERFLGILREAYLTPQSRAGVPLLQASDWFMAYRKGPFAMYALREYVGNTQVTTALRRLFEQHRSATPPLATSLDLYRELQLVTPDSLRYLLSDLFESNTYWQVATTQASAEQVEAGKWRVTLDVKARKVVVDTIGVEKEVSMNDLVEIGAFGPPKDGGPGEPLYLRMHRVHSGEQRITVTVTGKPARGGIDPRSLLIDVNGDDNLQEVTLSAMKSAADTGAAPKRR